MIGSTKTEQGLVAHADLDEGKYPIGPKVSDDELAGVRSAPDALSGRLETVAEAGFQAVVAGVIVGQIEEQALEFVEEGGFDERADKSVVDFVVAQIECPEGADEWRADEFADMGTVQSTTCESQCAELHGDARSQDREDGVVEGIAGEIEFSQTAEAGPVNKRGDSVG